jgi:hypothetical protein
VYKAEDIARAVQGKLQGDLPAALDAVETRWASDPLSLPDVVTWLLGHHPTVLERPLADFPLVACLVPDRSAGERSSQWGLQKTVNTVYVDCFVASTSVADVNKMCWRYVEAVVSVAQSYELLASGLRQVAFEPAVQLSETMRQYEDNSDTEFFTQMGRVTLRVES